MVSVDIIMRELLAKANKDPLLEGGVLGFRNRDTYPIKYKGKVVGFYILLSNTRTGAKYDLLQAVYITPAYRGKALAYKALLKLESATGTGCWIDQTNEVSISLFKKLNWIKRDEVKDSHGNLGNWWVNPSANKLIIEEEIKR